MDAKELRDYMNNISTSELGDMAKKAAQKLFSTVDTTNEDNLIITSAIAKKAFIDVFELEYEFLFVKAETNEDKFE